VLRGAHGIGLGPTPAEFEAGAPEPIGAPKAINKK